VDNENVLRCDHKITFVGLTILRLHYKMTLAGKSADGVPERSSAAAGLL